MTHDTPHDTTDDLRWCENCQLNVEPTSGDTGPACPSCGTDF